MKIPGDMHVHSRFSVDAAAEIGAMCQAAVERGLGYIAFTEHFDLFPGDPGYGFFNPEKYFKAVDSARREYGARIRILAGLEFGEPHLYPWEFEEITKLGFDFILGSVHMVDEVFVGEKYLLEKYTAAEIFEKYYAEVLKAVKFGGFDALAHFDFPKRYQGAAPVSGHVAGIMREMVKNGIALEINTSPLRKGLKECAPGTDILVQYLNCGGSKITFGSDAHRVGDVAAGFSAAATMLAGLDCAQVGVFVGRKFIIP
jgi:histidinol-phosphatase (PHP family)